MKRPLFFLLALFFTLSASSQLFKRGDIVEVDPSLSDSLKGAWQQATFWSFDSVTNKYTVKPADGHDIIIPSAYPEKWIRPVVNTQVINKYGPGAHINYEKRTTAIKLFKCNPSEAGVKKNIRSLMASRYKDHPYISVDFTSFKAQNGYDDKNNTGQQIYPYKIEMLVHLKRTLIMGGREYTEYQTWEFEDCIYEYATRKGKNCEFYPVTTSDAKLISRAWY